MDLIHGCRILFSFLFVTVTSFSFRPYKNNLTRYFGNKEKGRAIILEWNYCPHSWLTFRDMPWVQLVLNVAVIVLHQFTNGGWSICCYDDNADTPLKEVVKTPLKPNHLHHHRTARFCNRENNIVWSKYVSAFSIQWTAHRVGAVLHSCALIYLNQLKMNDFFSGIILKRICAIDIELTCGTSSPESGDGVAPKPWDKKKKKDTNYTIQIKQYKLCIWKGHIATPTTDCSHIGDRARYVPDNEGLVCGDLVVCCGLVRTMIKLEADYIDVMLF